MFRLIFVLSFVLVFSTISSTVNAQNTNNDCELYLKKTWVPKRTIILNEKTGELEIPAVTKIHIINSRNALRNLHQLALKDGIGVDYYIQRLLLAGISGKNVFVSGGPGATKSTAPVRIFSHKTEMPTGEIKQDLFQLQFSQQTPDSKIRGYVNPNNPSEIIIDGTPAQNSYVIFDEVDKANPQLLAAVNDLLNERILRLGDKIIPARLETAISTSNMNLYELKETWARDSMGANFDAFMGRQHFRVYMNNYLPNEKNRLDLMLLGQNRSSKKALSLLANPEKYAAASTVMSTVSENSIQVDLKILGLIGYATMKTDSSSALHQVIDVAVNYIKTAYVKRMQTSKEESLQTVINTGAPSPVYTPSIDISNRDIVENLVQTIYQSVLLDLYLLPDEILPNEQLLKIIHSGTLPVSAVSAWRLSQIVTMAGPGDAVPVVIAGGKGKQNELTIKFTNEIQDMLIPLAANENTRFTLESILFERKTVQEALTLGFQKVKQESQNAEEILESLGELLGTKKSKYQNIEEFLIAVKYSQFK